MLFLFLLELIYTMGGLKKSKNKGGKKSRSKLGLDVDWDEVEKKLIHPLCISSGVTALRAFRDVKFESVLGLKQIPLWLEAATGAVQLGKDYLLYQFSCSHGDIGSTLIRAQHAQCILSRTRRIPSEHIDILIANEQTNECIRKVCLEICETEQGFIKSVIQEQSTLNEACFIAYCANNYCMSTLGNLSRVLTDFLHARNDVFVQECVICCEPKNHYSSLWKCNHVVCEACCINISDSEYRRCPLCRSDILDTVKTDIPISLVSETIEYLDILKVHELKLIDLLETHVLNK